VPKASNSALTRSSSQSSEGRKRHKRTHQPKTLLAPTAVADFFGRKRHALELTVNVLDIQVDTLVLALLLHPRGLVVPPQLFIPLTPLLSSTDEQLFPLEIRIVQLVDGSSSILVFLVVDESESLVLARFVELKSARDDGSKGLEKTVEFVLSGGYQKRQTEHISDPVHDDDGAPNVQDAHPHQRS